MKKIGLGIIGLGYMGKIHLRNSPKLTNAHLVAVSDVSRKALNEAKKAGAKETFTNYEQLLKNNDIDAVIIALPTHLHSLCACKAAEAKKQIFLEKPIASNVADAKKIISAAQRNDVRLMIGYPLRFNNVMVNLKEQVKSGFLGDVEVAHAINVSTGPFYHRAQDYAPSPVPEWWFKKELTGGGALIDLGSHMINLLRWYFGEITDIKSHLGYRFNMDLEDHAICIAQFESGTTAVINVGWFSQEFHLKVELLGTVKHSVASNIPPNRMLAAAQMLIMNNSTLRQPFVAELGYFVNCIANDRQTHPSGNDGLKDLEAIELAYKNSIQLKQLP